MLGTWATACCTGAEDWTSCIASLVSSCPLWIVSPPNWAIASWTSWKAKPKLSPPGALGLVAIFRNVPLRNNLDITKKLPAVVRPAIGFAKMPAKDKPTAIEAGASPPLPAIAWSEIVDIFFASLNKRSVLSLPNIAVKDSSPIFSNLVCRALAPLPDLTILIKLAPAGSPALDNIFCIAICSIASVPSLLLIVFFNFVISCALPLLNT